MNNQVQIYNSKNLNAQNPTSPLLKYQQQHQQQQPFQFVHIPCTQNDIFESLQQKQLKLNAELQLVQNYIDINSSNISSIQNLNSHQSSNASSYSKTSNQQMHTSSPSFLNQNQLNIGQQQTTSHSNQQQQHQTKPHPQIQHSQISQLPVANNQGLMHYNANFSINGNFSQNQMQLASNSASQISYLQSNSSQLQSSSSNDLISDKQNQAQLHSNQFYSKNIASNPTKQQIIQFVFRSVLVLYLVRTAYF